MSLAYILSYVMDIIFSHRFAHLAPDVTEWPDCRRVPSSRERNADNDEEQVSHCEVDDERICGAAHMFTRGDDNDDEEVSSETENSDDAEDGGHDEAYDAFEAVDVDKLVGELTVDDRGVLKTDGRLVLGHCAMEFRNVEEYLNFEKNILLCLVSEAIPCCLATPNYFRRYHFILANRSRKRN